MRAPSDRPPVAGFGRVDVTLPQRLKKLGTYDGKWLRTLSGYDNLGMTAVSWSAHVVVQANTAGNLAADFSIVIDNNAALTVNDFDFGLVI